jgi:hypothetical protein
MFNQNIKNGLRQKKFNDDILGNEEAYGYDNPVDVNSAAFVYAESKPNPHVFHTSINHVIEKTHENIKNDIANRVAMQILKDVDKLEPLSPISRDRIPSPLAIETYVNDVHQMKKLADDMVGAFRESVEKQVGNLNKKLNHQKSKKQLPIVVGSSVISAPAVVKLKAEAAAIKVDSEKKKRCDFQCSVCKKQTYRRMKMADFKLLEVLICYHCYVKKLQDEKNEKYISTLKPALVEPEAFRVGKCPIQTPVLYAVKAIIGNTDVWTSAFPYNNVITVPRHGVDRPDSVCVINNNVEYPLTQNFKINDQVFDQVMYDLPPGCKRTFNSSVKVGEITPGMNAILFYLQPRTGKMVTSVGVFEEKIILGKDSGDNIGVDVWTFTGSSVSGSCGGVYYDLSTGNLVAFHGATKKKVGINYAFPIGDNWSKRVNEYKTLPSRDPMSDKNYGEVLSSVLNNKFTMECLKEIGLETWRRSSSPIQHQSIKL